MTDGRDVIARQLVVEAIQFNRCILDCFVPRNDGMRQFEMHPDFWVHLAKAVSQVKKSKKRIKNPYNQCIRIANPNRRTQ